MYYFGFSTNHIVPDGLFISSGYTAATYVWPKYAMGDLEPTQ